MVSYLKVELAQVTRKRSQKRRTHTQICSRKMESKSGSKFISEREWSACLCVYQYDVTVTAAAAAAVAQVHLYRRCRSTFFVTFDCQCIQLLVRHKSAVWSPFLLCGCLFSHSTLLDVVKKSQAKQQSHPSIWSTNSDSLAPCLYFILSPSHLQRPQLNSISFVFVFLIIYLSFETRDRASNASGSNFRHLAPNETSNSGVSEWWDRCTYSSECVGVGLMCLCIWCDRISSVQHQFCVARARLTTWNRGYWYSFSFIKKSLSWTAERFSID